MAPANHRILFGATWHSVVKNLAWAAALCGAVVAMATCSVRQAEIKSERLADQVAVRVIERLEMR